MVPSAYIDLPQTLCWNSKETLPKKMKKRRSNHSKQIIRHNKSPQTKIGERKQRVSIVTFHQVTSDDTYEMHDQANAPLELPPSQIVAWDLVSFVSDKSIYKFKFCLMSKLEDREKERSARFTKTSYKSKVHKLIQLNIIVGYTSQKKSDL